MEVKTSNNEKVAIVGTPCHMIAATKMDEFSDILGESPIDIKIGFSAWKTSQVT